MPKNTYSIHTHITKAESTFAYNNNHSLYGHINYTRGLETNRPFWRKQIKDAEMSFEKEKKKIVNKKCIVGLEQKIRHVLCL